MSMELIVRRRRNESDGVVSLVLGREDGGELPAWGPGAHVDLVLPSGLLRQYSLSSEPRDRTAWRVAVLDEPEGRGGSAEVHRVLHEGALIEVSEPRNHFVLNDAPGYLFLAGGIGITPILPMVARATAMGRDWHLVFGGRTRASMPFVDELAQYGDRVTLVPQDELGLIDLEASLGAAVPGTTLVYACGPEAMLTAVEQAMESWPADTLRTERFRAGELDSSIQPHAFEVECTVSGVTLEIGPEESILQVAQDAGLPAFASCEEGTCGTCLTKLLAGAVHHRDSLLTEDERARQNQLCICVSRAVPGCSKLVLEL